MTRETFKHSFIVIYSIGSVQKSCSFVYIVISIARTRGFGVLLCNQCWIKGRPMCCGVRIVPHGGWVLLMVVGISGWGRVLVGGVIVADHRRLFLWGDWRRNSGSSDEVVLVVWGRHLVGIICWAWM